MTLPEALELGIQHHRAGRLADAEAMYRQILAAQPDHADALHLLGLIAHQMRRHDIAIDLIQKAITFSPAAATFYSNLGVVLKDMGRLDDAVAACRSAVQLNPELADAHKILGNALMDKRQFDEAIAAYRRALQIMPACAQTHYCIGVALTEQGRLAEAIPAYRTAIQLKPDHAEAHNNLANALRGKGRPDEVIAAYLQAIQSRPDYAEAHNNLGFALREQGRIDEALAAHRRAIELKPDLAEAHNNLGNALMDKARFDEAVVAYRRAIELRPGYVQAHSNLGNALRDNGQLDEAIAAHRRAIQLNPDYADAHNNLGNALRDKGHLDEAIAECHRALELRPDYADALNNLGYALKERGQVDEAISSYRRALQLKPAMVEARNNLGNALQQLGLLTEAVGEYRAALQFKPDSSVTYNNLGCALRDSGLVDEAVAAYRTALQIQPGSADAHCNLLLGLHSLPHLDSGLLFREHRRWDEMHAQPLAKFIEPHGNDRNPDRRLRIGYVSPDFREHSVAFFIEEFLARHDRDHFEVFCYANVIRPDAFTARLQQHARHWRNIVGMSEAQVAGLVRADRIDILVDVAGHTRGNRLLIFARKPAPVQVTYLGYMDTTGMSAMDYRLTDPHADPVGTTEHLHSEQLIRLPDIFACFRPAQDSPPVGALPSAERRYVKFGSFHTLAKLNDPLLEWWSKILLQVPDSRLLLVTAGFNDAGCRQRFGEFFAGKGVGLDRLEFKGHQPLRRYLELHNEVDLLLDSHPYSGHTVGCHALWMGVPIVTLAGERHCSRMVTSVLANLDLPELIARTPGEYVRIATELAADLPRLAQLRSTLRERMQASPLTDSQRFTRAVEHAYREMWRTWCANAS